MAGPKVQSHKRLGQSGPLSGQQHFQGINSARACIGLEPLWDPPAPVVFGPSPIGQLVITNGEDGVRLMLQVSGTIATDIMVFGQAPCSAGRRKRRNVAFLGLLPAPQGTMCEITALYVARYGEPRPGEKVFIVTCQQQDGWEGFEQETNEIAPQKPAVQPASASGTLTLQVPMHKGGTTHAQRTAATVEPVPPMSNEPSTPDGEAAQAPQGESKPLTRPSATLSPSDGERDGVRGCANGERDGGEGTLQRAEGNVEDLAPGRKPPFPVVPPSSPII